MIMFWALWLSLVLVFISSIIGVFAWNGILLELVKIKTAKKLWLVSAVAVLIGVLLFIWSVMTIINSPQLIGEFSAVYQTSPPFLVWVAVLLLVVGGFVVGIPTQLYQLKFVRLSRKARNNLFYLGMALLVVGVLFLMWIFLPGNQLPA